MHIDDIIANSKPAVRSVRVSIRGDLLDLADQLEEQLQEELRRDTVENRKPQAPGIARQIEELHEEAEADGNTVTWKFKALGQRAWSELIRKHPPNAQHRKTYGRDIEYHPEKFPVAAIAASCVEPDGVTVEKVDELLETWNFAQWSRLWQACLAVNVGDTSVPFSASASAALGRSEQKPTTPSPEGSPDGGSSESPDGR